MKRQFSGIGSVLLVLGLAWVCHGSATAETLRYGLEIPDGESVTYLLDLDVRHPGNLVVRAEWSGKRSVSLKLTPPGRAYGALLRSGPSPQELETTIKSQGFEAGVWTLRIFSLSDRGRGEGSLVIELPGPLPEVPETVPNESKPVDRPEPEPWMRPFHPSSPVRTNLVPFLEATERFRRDLFGSEYEAPHDVCQWQVPLMQYLADLRTSILSESHLPSETTGKFLDRLATTIESVDRMRLTDDPLVNGPAPDDPALRNAWLKLRTTKIDPVEDQLDQLLSLLRRGHVPDLESEEWPLRLVSCLTACERYFEQRARLGEKRAGNRDLALTQWPRMLSAGEAISSLVELPPSRRAGQ
jgi:hypothetical protein